MIFSKITKIIVLLALLLLSGCDRGSENVFLDKTPIVVTFERIVNLEGRGIGVDEIGLTSFDIVDSIMIFMTPQLETLYSVFSFNDVKMRNLTNVVTSGQGPDEFLQSLRPMFFKKKENQILVAFSDFYRRRIRYLNLTQSILAERAIFDDKIIDLQMIDGFINNAVPLNCNFLLIDHLDVVNLNHHYSIFDIGKGEIVEDNLVIVSNLRERRSSFLLATTNVFNKERKMYAGAMYFLDQINFYNIAYPDQSFAVTTNRNRRRLSAIEGVPMPEKIEYYIDFRSTDSHLFGLYVNMGRREVLRDRPAVIHVFDWKGNPIVELRTAEKIATFDIDPINNRLYGLTMYEELFVYDLKGLL